MRIAKDKELAKKAIDMCEGYLMFASKDNLGAIFMSSDSKGQEQILERLPGILSNRSPEMITVLEGVTIMARIDLKLKNKPQPEDGKNIIDPEAFNQIIPE